MRNRIEWEAWVNPYTKDASKEFVSEEEGDTLYAKEKLYQDSYEKAEQKNEDDYRMVIPSPLGAVPVTIYHNFKEYQFWKGNTNFIIDDEVKEILNTTLGVERLTVYTPYVFMIGIGKLFTSSDVKVEIQKRLNAMPLPKGEINPFDVTLPKSIRQKVDLMKSQMTNAKYSAILVLPNAEIHPLMTDDKDMYDATMETFHKIQEATGAVIITNNE